ncbi:MAG: hypothetical protein K8R23_05600 [Chthoniobacter sp.]|nr:hypothetical protein [Chthoniobacter sp.]
MSRSFRLLLCPLVLLALGLAGCRTSTPYTRIYSPRKSYYAALPEKKERSADELMKATETPPPGTGPDSGLPKPPPLPGAPAIPGTDPGAPAVPPPAADPLAPAAPAAPL